jgi:hypothetical protein
VSPLLIYLPSCDDRKQELVPKLFGARDDPHQVWCMGRQRGLRLYDAQSYEVLLAQRVRRYSRVPYYTRMLIWYIIVITGLFAP